jgi:solute carrier family 25 oxoglutarate transporter 11
MVVNAAQLATYSQAKQVILSTGYVGDNIACHFVASMISGLATTIASMPVDIAKTRCARVHAFCMSLFQNSKHENR